MDRPPPCKFYQSGFCAKGDDCPFSHPIQRCRSFTQDGFCPYGVHCHYWHDFKNFALTASTNTPVQKVCRFFLNGQCNYGDACAYSHQLDDVEAPNQITLTEYRLQQQMAQLSAPNPLISVSPQSSTAQVLSSTNSSRLAVARPSARLEQAYRSALQPGDLEKMRDLEVDRLLKRFPPSQLKQTSCNNDGVRAFSLIFSSTDPEWLHKVKQILLFISLPAQYPSSPPILNVPKTSDIPNVVTAKINEAITNWVNERQSANASANKVSLFLRPFFFWLDKTLNRLLTDGYALVEATNEQEEEEGVGLQIPEQFDSPINLCLPSSPSVTVDKMNLESMKMAKSGKREESASEEEEKEEEEEEEERKKQGRGKTKTVGEEEEEEEEEGEEGEGEEGEGERDEVGREGKEKVEVDISAATIQQQDFSFEGLELRGQAGTCLFVRLPVYCTCSRCKYPFEWVFRLPPSPLSPPSTSPSTSTREGRGGGGGAAAAAAAQSRPLTSVPPHTSSCQRCRQPLGLIFTGALIHTFACRVGSFQLANCLLFEVQVRSAEALISCVNCCNAEVRITGLQPDRVIARRCHGCHAPCGIVFSSVNISKPRQAPSIICKQFGLLSINKAAKGTVRQKWVRMSGDHASANSSFIIQKGTPLPNNGTCRHYRKSFRWLRFPCCQRAFPCDNCHDEEVAGAHETLHATRIICGFCSTEQPEVTTSPMVVCSACQRNLTSAGATNHWEGGRGCRDPVKMSRKDNRKHRIRR
uniref:RING-type E3 ubiquitin transferase n=1 Tax=Echinococcus granulosus TaxID=6210 RepID=A0A068WXK4_ECHGR|nr:Zinc finger CCCH type [Echinococcus granulosus]